MARTDATLAVRGMNRFGLGLRGDGADNRAMLADPRGFVKADLDQSARLPGDGLMDTASALVKLDAEQKQRKANRAMPAMSGDAMADGTPKFQREVYEAEAAARFARAFEAPCGFVERLVWFWSNHFAVSVAKGQPLMVTAGSFEREAIRPHVLGRFADMLLAVEQHPAMLFYLDNRNSIGPNSRGGQKRGKGLNENLAREILELHTLGVNAGYAQTDVTALAKMITGWSYANPRQQKFTPGEFMFNVNTHEPGMQTLLGRSYADGGVEQGEAALRDLAAHKATAKHIAFKMARHFVSDVPPPELVERLSDVFVKTGGDLKAVSLALIDSDIAWATPRNKMRSPMEFFVAANRALGLPQEKPQRMLRVLEQLGQPLWRPPGPNGFGDTNDIWASAEGLKLRLEVSAIMARQTKLSAAPVEVLQAISGGVASKDTVQAVQRAESAAQGLALMLMSPEVQRR